MIPQKKSMDEIKKCFKISFPGSRMIKIHGSKYQEAGLPDVMILTRGENINFWLEIKNDWKKDSPKTLQNYNIKDLRSRGFATGFVVGGEFKEKWDDPDPVPLILILGKYK